MRHLRFRLFPFLLGFCFCLQGCRDRAVIRIASHSPLTGNKAPSGLGVKKGAQLALDQLSDPLRKMGFVVEFVSFDDQAKPEVGEENARTIVADPTILAVVGHQNSGVHLPASEIYHGARLASISPSTTNPQVTDRGYLEVNRICGRDDVQGAVGAQFAASCGIRSVYVLHDKTLYGHGIADYFRREAELQGVRILGIQGTDEKVNFAPVLAPALAMNPQAIYWAGGYESAALVKQARAHGFKGLFLSVDSFDGPDAAAIAGDALLEGAGTYFSTIAGPAFAYSDTAKFIADYKATYGAAPHPSAAKSYDCAAMILKAIEKAAREKGGELPTRTEVAKAIRGLSNFSGITGVLTFNGKGDPEVAKYFVIQVTSADPARWASNRVDRVLDIAPPR